MDDHTEILGQFHLIERRRFDEAIAFFRSRLDAGEHLAPYGLATAIFRKKSITLDVEECWEVIELYEKSIALKPDFPDAFLMCGLAYEKLASALTGQMKKAPLEDTDRKAAAIKEAVRKAMEYLRRSVQINPGFEKAAMSGFERFERRMQGIENLRVSYNEDRRRQER